MESRHRKLNGRIYIRSKSDEIRGEKNVQRFGDAGESFVGGTECSLHFGPHIERQHRLVHLNPCRSSFSQPAKYAFVDRKNTIKQGKRIKAWLFPLSKKEERYRAEQHRAGVDAKRFGLQKFIDGFQRSEGKLLIFRELGNNVVVVRIEPLRHLHR